MIYEPSYIYPNVLNAQGERCFYTTTTNTFKVLINSDYPITSCSYEISNQDGSRKITGSKTGMMFYTNSIDGEQHLLEVDGVDLRVNNKINVRAGVNISPSVFDDSTWTYNLTFTDSMGNELTTKTYAFYITPSEQFTYIDGNESITINSRFHTFDAGFSSDLYISWIQWSIYNKSNLVFTTDKVYRSVDPEFYFDGFDSNEVYTVEFKACDSRGNISASYQTVNSVYDYVDTSTSVKAVPQKDTSILVDWSSFQGITGKADTSVTTSFNYSNDIPAEGHNSVALSSGRLLFKGSNDIDIHIPADDYLTWSGALFGNTDNIIEAITDEGSTTLSLKGYEDGLNPATTLYPSDTLYPKDVIKGRFEVQTADGKTFIWDRWLAGLDVNNSWFVVEISSNGIKVVQTRWDKE